MFNLSRQHFSLKQTQQVLISGTDVVSYFHKDFLFQGTSPPRKSPIAPFVKGGVHGRGTVLTLNQGELDSRSRRE